MMKKHKIGDIVTVEIIGMQDYGAFVKLLETENDAVTADRNSVTTHSHENQENTDAVSADNTDNKGLIHISEIQSGYVKNIRDVVKVGQVLSAQIIDIDEFNGKISLSMRSLEQNPQTHRTYHKKHFTDARNKIGFASLAKNLDNWVLENQAYLDEQALKKQ